MNETDIFSTETITVVDQFHIVRDCSIKLSLSLAIGKYSAKWDTGPSLGCPLDYRCATPAPFDIFELFNSKIRTFVA